MTREELERELELALERSREAIEEADAYLRESEQQHAIHRVTTKRLLEDLREIQRR